MVHPVVSNLYNGLKKDLLEVSNLYKGLCISYFLGGFRLPYQSVEETKDHDAHYPEYTADLTRRNWD